MIASADGIVELANIDQANQAALAAANTILSFAASTYPILFIAWLLGSFVPEATITFLFIFGVCLVMCLFNLVRWHQNYSAIEFPDNNYKSAVRAKNMGGILAAIALAKAIGIAYFRFF